MKIYGRIWLNRSKCMWVIPYKEDRSYAALYTIDLFKKRNKPLDLCFLVRKIAKRIPRYV